MPLAELLSRGEDGSVFPWFTYMTPTTSKSNNAKLEISDSSVREVIHQEIEMTSPETFLRARLQLLRLWFADLHFDEFELFLFIVDQEP